MPATFYANGLRVIDADLLGEIVRRVSTKFNPKRIVVFGSVARGQAGPDSDLDLFVEMESPERFLDRCVAVRRLLSDLDVAMDVVVYTPAEVAAQRGRLGTLLSYVEDGGRTLYERP